VSLTPQFQSCDLDPHGLQIALLMTKKAVTSLKESLKESKQLAKAAMHAQPASQTASRRAIVRERQAVQARRHYTLQTVHLMASVAASATHTVVGAVVMQTLLAPAQTTTKLRAHMRPCQRECML
jgi:hypothetical protein